MWKWGILPNCCQNYNRQFTKSSKRRATEAQKNGQFVENVAEINVKRTVKSIIQRSYILEQMVENGEIGIIGAMYNIETGTVEFYPETEFIKDEKNPELSLKELVK